jgi:TolB protein
MSFRLLLQVAVLLALASPPAAQPTLGAFEAHADVGAVRHPGSVSYEPDSETYTISGSGANMWLTSDEFYVVYRRMGGDFILTADAAFVGEGVDPHRKMGWIVRAGLDPAAAYADVAVHGDGLASLQYRRAAGDSTREFTATLRAPDVIRLERIGGVYSMSVARRGEPFETVGLTDDVDLPDEVLVGLFVCSHNPGVVETATFTNVRVTVPAPPDFRPYQDYIGARLEVMDVETGRRRVVMTSAKAVQAPNWTPDGEALIYNEGGRLYRFDLASGTSTEIPTGFATANNNDHVLSPDGRQIAISHHSSDHNGQSIIYRVPIEGGTPTQVTARGPSYLHGWSPDGSTLLYTAQREGDYDVYAISVTGGEETRLTATPGLDDGAEFSPDGAWVYFNSARSGTMQLWRMRPDGSGAERLTWDGMNDWFPHVSPDGRQVVSLTYKDEVEPSDHPWYRRVYLRRMPAEGGKARVVAYLYGGQGTINVPSWSPDSRHVAFVSNSAGAE